MEKTNAPAPAEAVRPDPVIEAMAREFFQQLSLLSTRATQFAIQIERQKARIAQLEAHAARLEEALGTSAQAAREPHTQVN